MPSFHSILHVLDLFTSGRIAFHHTFIGRIIIVVHGTYTLNPTPQWLSYRFFSHIGCHECSQISDQPRYLVLQDVHFSIMHVLQILDFHHVHCFEFLNGCNTKSLANNISVFYANINAHMFHDSVNNIFLFIVVISMKYIIYETNPN